MSLWLFPFPVSLGDSRRLYVPARNGTKVVDIRSRYPYRCDVIDTSGRLQLQRRCCCALAARRPVYPALELLWRPAIILTVSRSRFRRLLILLRIFCNCWSLG